jgi:hypothetical protein
VHSSYIFIFLIFARELKVFDQDQIDRLPNLRLFNLRQSGCPAGIEA